MYKIIVAGVCSALLAQAGCRDVVRLSNGGEGENGILLDGSINSPHVNDADFTGPASSPIPVGRVSLSPQSNELIAYTTNRPPTLMPNVAWTTGSDSIELAFADKITVKFTVWIVNVPPGRTFEEQRKRAIDAGICTSMIWTNERIGIGFDRESFAFNVRNATNNPNAHYYYHFNILKAATIQAQIGFDADAINVYYVGTVDYGSGPAESNGVYFGSGVLALGANASDHLFAHEVGHFFALTHVDLLSTADPLTTLFDNKNVMHSASNDREHLTEGQTFRAIFMPSSAINWPPFNLRPGLPTRNCFDNTIDHDACPVLQKRIWADGALPAK